MRSCDSGVVKGCVVGVFVPGLTRSCVQSGKEENGEKAEKSSAKGTKQGTGGEERYQTLLQSTNLTHTSTFDARVQTPPL